MVSEGTGAVSFMQACCFRRVEPLGSDVEIRLTGHEKHLLNLPCEYLHGNIRQVHVCPTPFIFNPLLFLPLLWQVECAVHNPEPHINVESTADTPVVGHGCVWVRHFSLIVQKRSSVFFFFFTFKQLHKIRVYPEIFSCYCQSTIMWAPFAQSRCRNTLAGLNSEIRFLDLRFQLSVLNGFNECLLANGLTALLF